MSTYHETPVYEEPAAREPLCREMTVNKGQLLIGMGAFVLLAQIIPGNFFLPLVLVALGSYFLRQRKGRGEENKLTKGHFLVGLGTFILLLQVLPGNLVLPLALIGAGIYFLRKQGEMATE